MAYFGRESSVAGSDGDGISRITFYSLPNFSGDSKTCMDSSPNAKSILGEGTKICSMVVQGNPWVFYPEENMKVCKDKICNTVVLVKFTTLQKRITTLTFELFNFK